VPGGQAFALPPEPPRSSGSILCQRGAAPGSLLCFDVSETTVVHLPGQGGADQLKERPIAASASYSARANAGEPPAWKRECGELWYAGRLIKEFKQPAPNQRAILDAFQEQSWDHVIDDPLPGKADIDPRKRLGDAVAALNHLHGKRAIVLSRHELGRRRQVGGGGQK